MKYVKENLTLVIVGTVVVLFLVAAFVWPIPSYSADLKAKMQARADYKKTIQQIGTTPLALPGMDPVKGPPTQEWVEKKKETIEAYKANKEHVDEAARISNSQSRVTPDKGLPLLPIPLDAQMSKVGKDVSDHLPTSNDPMDYKGKYIQLFKYWPNLLTRGTLSDADGGPTTPPRFEEVSAAFTEQQAAAQAKLPPGAAAALGGGLPGQPGGKAMTDFVRAQVMNRAAGLRMYIEPYPMGFQVRDWAFKDLAPTQQQIFESLVDSWIQSDIVKAILTVNNEAMGSTSEKNVGKAAIKRLTRVIIGNAARVHPPAGGGSGTGQSQAPDPGPLFYTGAGASLGGTVAAVPVTPDAGAAPAEAPPNTVNLELSMTGRSAGADYDIVQVQILVDIDPAYLNTFVNAIYKQNMGYTEVSRQVRLVDPLDRASNGYLYGDNQVVEAEIQMEALFFRSWTSKVMPDSVKLPLGIKIEPATAPAAAP